jgi:YVTN family beta-propeller protein
MSPAALAINPQGTRLYVANYVSDDVSVIDTVGNKVIGSPIPVGHNPYAIMVNSSDTLVYVANRGSRTVSVIDVAAGKVIETIPYGKK